MEIKRVIWAFDPFEVAPKLHRASAKLLRFLTRRQDMLVEAVYVMNPEEVWFERGTAAIASPVPATQKALDNAVQEASESTQQMKRGPRIENTKVLLQARPSLGESVHCLANYAFASGADLIACETHARSGLARLLLGSFTERLLNESKVPLLVINPAARPKAIRKILFATDLSAKSKSCFLKLLSFAQNLGAEIVLLYVAPHIFEPLVQEGAYLMGGGWLPILNEVQVDLKELKTTAEDWVDLAAKKGIQAQCSFEINSRGIAPAILAHAKRENVQLIAMSSESGPIRAALLGSIAQQVMREARCPVWVAHAA